MASSKQLHFHGPYLKQNWLLPDSLIYYITMNPTSSKVWQKLVQTCKYFFAKNPVLVIDKSYYAFNTKLEIKLNKQQNLINFTSVLCKFWITGEFGTADYGTSPNFLSSIIPYIFKFEAKALYLYSLQMSYNEFMFLSTNVESLILIRSIVKDKDGSNVSLEKLIKTLPKICDIKFSDNPISSSITKNTVKELIETPHFLKMDDVIFLNISEAFDIDTFFIYAKKNKHTKFCLTFCGSISEAYQNRVEKIIDEILATKNHVYIPPYMHFYGLAYVKYLKMDSFL